MIDRLFKRLFKHIDGFLMGCLFLTLLLGLFVLFSASGENWDRMGAQLTNITVALLIMWVAANIPPQHLERIALPLYILGLLLLLRTIPSSTWCPRRARSSGERPASSSRRATTPT